jgi:type 1 fimbria pilin
MYHQKSQIKQQRLLLSVGIIMTAISVFFSPYSAHADGSLGEINIRLSGTVVALGCTVDPGDIDKPVKLGEWATKQLRKAGDTTNAVYFSIRLTGCTASVVTTAFTGARDKQASSLLALNREGADSAQGVAVQIMDSTHQRIPMGDDTPQETVDADGDATLSFYANYMATGNDGVMPGTADANTEFTLTYD